jgi:ABC-2 type transporter
MEREFANKMFSPTAYFMGRFLSTLMVQILYPLIMIMVTFWAIGIDTSFDNFIYMIYYGFLANFVFCG